TPFQSPTRSLDDLRGRPFRPPQARAQARSRQMSEGPPLGVVGSLPPALLEWTARRGPSAPDPAGARGGPPRRGAAPPSGGRPLSGVACSKKAEEQVWVFVARVGRPWPGSSTTGRPRLPA